MCPFERLFARIKIQHQMFFLPWNLLFFAIQMNVVRTIIPCPVMPWILSLTGMTTTTTITG